MGFFCREEHPIPSLHKPANKNPNCWREISILLQIFLGEKNPWSQTQSCTDIPRHPSPRQQVKSECTENFSFLQFPFSCPPAFSSATHGGGHVTTRIPDVRQIIFPSVGCFFPAQFMFFNGSGICEVLAVNDPCRSSASCPASHFWLLQLLFCRGQEWVQLTAAGTPRKGKLFFFPALQLSLPSQTATERFSNRQRFKMMRNRHKCPLG